MKLNFAACSVVFLCSLQLHASTTDDMITLAEKNVGEEVMLASVEHSRDSFNLSATDILKLKNANVPDKVIAAMIRHRATVRPVDAVVAQPRESPPTAPPAALPGLNATEGTLTIENIDSKTWSYMYEPGAQTIWISSASEDERGNLNTNGGIRLRMPVGSYKIRYNGQTKNGPTVEVFAGETSILMLNRIESGGRESLNVSVFEHGEKKSTQQLVVLNENPRIVANREAEQPAANRERVVERVRVVEVPTETVIYRNNYCAPSIFTSSDYYYPYYRRPYCGSNYYPSSHYGYSSYHGHHGHHSNVSVGIGLGF